MTALRRRISFPGYTDDYGSEPSEEKMISSLKSIGFFIDTENKSIAIPIDYNMAVIDEVRIRELRKLGYTVQNAIV